MHYELKQSLVTTTDVAGEENTNTITQHMNLSTVIEKVLPDGSAQVNKKIDRIRLKASHPEGGQELEYDSAENKEVTGAFAMIVKSMAMLVNQDITMTISPQGEASNVSIPEDLVKRFSGPGSNLGGVNSAEGVKKMMSQGSVIFPDKPLAPGDTWQRDLTTDLPYGTMKSVIVFKYTGRTEKGLHRIDAVTKISIEPNANIPFQIKMTESEGHGIYMFDATQGVILASGLKQTMNMEITAVGQSTKQSVITDISMRLVEAKK
ncbi:MAG: hypothetical protein JKY95_16720 [Planctomycetaceae bacterium]|nr:hypothetical protein [Planctomycetaceae bacterium]